MTDQQTEDLLSQLGDLNLIPTGEAPYKEGPTEARIAFVGEAPGAEEVFKQRPFVGSSGDLFNELLRSAGIVRDSCYIDNVFQFRPHNNIITPYIKFGTKNVKESEEFKAARDALRERLERCKANVIVPLGNVPLYALTGLTAVTKRRGSILESTFMPGRKMMPTIHPAAASRQYLYQTYIVHDLKRSKQQSAFPEIKLLSRDLILEPSFLDACSYIENCMTKDMIAFDIEVSSEEVSHVSLATSATDAICIPFYESGGDYFDANQEGEVWRLLGKLLSNPDIVKLGQNIIFDTTFVNRKYGICLRPVEDTMVAAGILFPDYPKGLDFLVSIYCNGEPYYKDEGKKWRVNPFADNLTFRKYSAMDSAVLWEIFPQQVEELHRTGNYDTYVHQTAVIEPLVFIHGRGIKMDARGLKKASYEAETESIELQIKLNDIVGRPIKVNSSQQMQSYFYGEKGLKPYYKTVEKDGRKIKVVTCDEKALKRIAGKGYEEARIALEIRRLIKMKSTYYDVILDSDERLRCSYTPITKQGRLASGKTIFETGANLQNQPTVMKKMMINDPGFIFVNIDLSQAENRIVAYTANVRRMIKAFEAGEDVHRLTASFIFDKPPEEISDVKGSTTIGGGQYSERDIGKRADHGYNYGLGPEKFAIQNELSLQEGRFIHDRYHSIYSEIKRWHNAIVDELRRGRTLVNCYGHKRTFRERWGVDMFMGAYNFLPQSTVADKINREGLCYIYYNQQLFREVILLNQVHDSIVLQLALSIGRERITEILHNICTELETPISWKMRTFVIPTDVSIGFNLAKRDKDNPRGLIEYKSSEVYDTEAFKKKLKVFYR